MTPKTKESEEQGPDPLLELEAMRQLVSALDALSPAGRDRVLDWTIKFYRSKRAEASGLPGLNAQSDLTAGGSAELPDKIATLFAKANPGTESEKALVAAYWFLKHDGIEEIDSFRLNSELTHLGHRVSNITRALGLMITTKPALVVQTRKEGKTKQARKKYKLTVEGMRRVEHMLSGENSSEASS